MNKIVCCFILSASCGTFGCQVPGAASASGATGVLCRHGPGAGVSKIEASKALPAITVAAAPRPPAEAIPIQPTKSIQPVALVHPTESSKSIEIGEIKPATVEAIVVRDSVREASAVIAGLKSIPQTIVSIVASSKIPQKSESARETIAVEPAPEPSVFAVLWARATPYWSVLCAYVVAPLVVDLIKQRMASGRRSHRKKKPARVIA